MEAPAVTTGIATEDAQKIQKKQVCYASHEHEEFVVHVVKNDSFDKSPFFWILF